MPGQPRVLHREDSDDDRHLFRKTFEASGVKAELISIPSAFDAMVFLDQAGTPTGGDLPRIIVLDLSLPEIDGRDFLTFLPTNPPLPVHPPGGPDRFAPR